VGILAAAGRPPKPTDEVLDLGAGSGEIAEHLGTLANVVCAEAIDQRVCGSNLPIHVVARTLPFPEARFDVVASDHMIEHTGDPVQHRSEIRRVLRPGAVTYVATPNRLWPWECHAGLPLLHYLPWRLFSRLAMRLERLHEPVELLTLHRLRWLCRRAFQLEVWHHRVLHDRYRFALILPSPLRAVLRATPSYLLALSAALQPTLIVLFSPK
jgi:2-polyprenyl-3-methyl-5-hydroxy-6-metoxy-1,4-benzoquinol methylase